jgi:hypothetical protein
MITGNPAFIRPSVFLLILSSALLGNKTFTAVDFAELRLFNFAGWISWNFRKDDFVRSFISWQLQAELVDFIFAAGEAFFYLNDCRRDFTQPFIRQTDYGNILNGGICS